MGGTPLTGVSIILKGTTIVTVNDIDTNFKISVSDENTFLEAYYPGYRSQAITCLGKNMVIVMKEDINQLDEVVITVLAITLQRRNLANSVAKIDASELTGVAVPTNGESALL